MGKREEKKKGVILHVFLSYHNSICQPAPPKKKPSTKILRNISQKINTCQPVNF
jgi:hypothetical protein